MIFEVSARGRARHDCGTARVLIVARRTEAMMKRAVTLARAGFEVVGVSGAEEAARALGAGQYGAVVVDRGFLGEEGEALLAGIARSQPDATIVLLSRTGPDAIRDHALIAQFRSHLLDALRRSLVADLV